MSTSILRTAAATLTVVVLAAGAAYAAGVASHPSSPGEPGSVELATVDDPTDLLEASDRLEAPAVDVAPVVADEADDGASADTPDCGDAASEAPAAGVEDEPETGRATRALPRVEERVDDDRREVRTWVDHVGTQTYQAADAGSVTVTHDGATLTIAGVAPAGGWSPVVKRASGPEVEVTLRSQGRRVDFQAEIEHGAVKIRVRER